MSRDLEQQELYRSGEYTKYFAPEKKTFPFADIYEEKRQIILDRLDKRRKRILDVGGGRGRLSLPLSKKNYVIMVDLSLQMIREALDSQKDSEGLSGNSNHTDSDEKDSSHDPLTNGEDGTIDYVCSDAEHLPFDKESFDVVLAIDLIPHMQRPGRCIEELFSLVKPGGIGIIDNSNSVPLWMFAYPGYVDWKRNPIKFIRTFLHGGVLPNWADRITHLTRKAFINHIRNAGFIVMDLLELGPSYCPKWHIAFCRKPIR